MRHYSINGKYILQEGFENKLNKKSQKFLKIRKRY